MIIRSSAENLLAELHDELARKTLAVWNTYNAKTYDHYVPWMSCLPNAGEAVVDHPALSDQYDAGCIVCSPRLLRNINEYLAMPQASPIALDILKNLPPDAAKCPIAQKEVSQHVINSFLIAKQAVLNSHSLFSALFDRIVHVVVPIRMAQERMNESLDLARGAVFMSFVEPVDMWALELDLAHEFGHQALMIINSADPLFESDITAPVFSGIRLAERPAIQSLHAATALAFMILFTGGKPEATAQRATATFATQLHRTLDSIHDNCIMTEVGEAVLDDYSELCDKYSAQRNRNMLDL